MFWDKERDARTLDEMNEILTRWGRASQIRPRRYVSPTLLVIKHMEDNAKHPPEMKEDPDADIVINDSEETERIRRRVDEILIDNSKWARYEILRKAIRGWYYLTPPNANKGRFARLMGISNRTVKPLMIDAVRRFSYFW